MPISMVERSAALVVIDLQKAMIRLPSVHPIDDVIARSARLAQEFRKRKMPLGLVHVAGSAPGRTDRGAARFQATEEGWECVPELQQGANDEVITKVRWGAFLETGLNEVLQQRGSRQLVLVGVATIWGITWS